MKIVLRYYRFSLTFLFLVLLINPLFDIYLNGDPVIFQKKLVSAIPEREVEDNSEAHPPGIKQPHTPEMIASIFRTHHTDITLKKLGHVANAVYSESIKYGYDPFLILAIIKTESSFRNRAVSHVGARGLMQIIPKTAEEIARKNNIDWYGFKTLHTPISNIEMGTFYLTELLKKFDGNIVFALEAYNNGPARIKRLIGSGGQPNYRYAAKVLKNYRSFLNLFDKWG